MIHYWNKPYFEGLKAIGEAYKDKEHFHFFSEYCLKKELGLKKVANACSVKFVAELNKLSLVEQRKIIVEICELNYAQRDVHSLLNHHIEKMIASVLSVWVQDENSSRDANRWYVRYCPYSVRDQVLYKALELSPKDQILLDQYLNSRINNLEYMVHHLNENSLIWKRSQADVYLTEISLGLKNLIDGKFKNYVQSEYDYYFKLLKLWDEYSSIQCEERFVDWALDNHDFDW